MGGSPVAVASSEPHAHAAVDVSPFERRPRINRPAAVRGSCRAEQRIPSRLPDTGEILAVDEKSQWPELFLPEKADDHVGLADAAIGILFEALLPRVVPLDS